MRILLAGLVGGFLMFAWSAFSWMGLGFHAASLSTLPVQTEEMEIMLADVPEAGIYHYPGMPVGPEGGPPSAEQMEAVFGRMRQGPVVSFMVVHPQGVEPMAWQNFVVSVISSVIAATLAAMLLACAVDRLRTYGQRVLFVLGIGLFVIFGYYVQTWVWWGYTGAFALADIIDLVVGPLLGGLAIAAIVKPRAAAAETQPPAEGI